MGAAASVSAGADDQVPNTNNKEEDDDRESEDVCDVADLTEGMTTAIDSAPDAEAIADTNVEIEQELSEIYLLVDESQKNAIKTMTQDVGPFMSNNKICVVLHDLKCNMHTLTGDAILISFSSSLSIASDMAPEVASTVGIVLIGVAAHLPFIGVACAAVGAMAITFKMSKDADANVKTVNIWLMSVKDWLILIANNVSRSNAASTENLFKALQDAVKDMFDLIKKNMESTRIAKMVSSAKFSSDFERAKTVVLELKNALQEFLDHEAQTRQEKYLEIISETQIELKEMISNMSNDMKLIMELLTKRKEAENLDIEEEEIYAQIKKKCGVKEDDDIPFIRFLRLFQKFFYNSAKMPSEQKRALKIVLELDKTQMVDKSMWVGFYSKWMASKIGIEDFLIKVAIENPTLLTQGKAYVDSAKKKVSQVKEQALDVLAANGVSSFDDAKKVLSDSATKYVSAGFSLLNRKSSHGSKT